MLWYLCCGTLYSRKYYFYDFFFNKGKYMIVLLILSLNSCNGNQMHYFVIHCNKYWSRFLTLCSATTVFLRFLKTMLFFLKIFMLVNFVYFPINFLIFVDVAQNYIISLTVLLVLLLHPIVTVVSDSAIIWGLKLTMFQWMDLSPLSG